MMPYYTFECESCGLQFLMRFAMGTAADVLLCPQCNRRAGRVFTAPRLITRPTMLEDDNKWWWLKPGDTYSMQDKLEMDREDQKRYEAQHEEWAQQKKISDAS